MIYGCVISSFRAEGGGGKKGVIGQLSGGVGGRGIGDGGWDGGQVRLRGAEGGGRRKSDASDLSHGRQESDGSRAGEERWRCRSAR